MKNSFDHKKGGRCQKILFRFLTILLFAGLQFIVQQNTIFAQSATNLTQQTETTMTTRGQSVTVRNLTNDTLEERIWFSTDKKNVNSDSVEKQDLYLMQTKRNRLFDDHSLSNFREDSFLQGISKLDEEFVRELSEGFSFKFSILANEEIIDMSDSILNPQNMWGVPNNLFKLDLRPDFYLNYRKLRLMLKPRNIMTWWRIEYDTAESNSDWESEWFVNEWLAGLQLFDCLFVSYGRENIQWGPSWLSSPSNPFFYSNGLRNPKKEGYGKDFGRLVWIPNSFWSVSFIANTGKGTEGEDASLMTNSEFEPSYALKIDYTGYQQYISIIPSYREKDRAYLGAFAGWTVTDNLLLYAESSTSQGNNLYYPVSTGRNYPFTDVPWITLEQNKDESDSFDTKALFGTSYSFETGFMIALEYYYNGSGYDDEEFELIRDNFELLDRVVNFIGRFSSAFLQRIFDGIDDYQDADLVLLRQHYLNIQCQQLWADAGISLRYTYSLDDSSSQLIPMARYDLNDHFQVYVININNFGHEDTEFNMKMDSSCFVGIQYTF